ncbi:MAG: N-acetyl-gamma-glutamyl-phosphate reductase, partial [Bacteroidetes bacterium]
ELCFVGEPDLRAVDVLFFCTGHGQTQPFLAAQDVPEDLSIIDLSSDFRLAGDHDFVYGLPELQRARIAQAQRIANPGCFATAIQLGLLPLAAAGQLQQEVHIHALTGSTGAGQQPVATTHFSWRAGNVSAYKVFGHQHLAEIRQSLAQAQGATVPALNFIPLRGDFTRGIFASLYLNSDLSEAEARKLYQDFYHDHPFTHLTDTNPNLKQVVNTNKALLQVSRHGDKLLILSMIDNLLKGASGQAVQNMNLMFGLPETAGLDLKASYF